MSEKQADRLLCDVYRSPREEGMYLYVKRTEGLTRVPEELLQRFGKPEHALMLFLTPDRPLARVSVEQVMSSLADPGYYLQLPLRDEQDPAAARIHAHNAKW